MQIGSALRRTVGRTRVHALFAASAALFIAVGFFAVRVAHPQTVAGKQPLLQFTGGGQVLGFETGGVYVAGGDHALKITFVDAASVAPSAGEGAPANVKNRAQPLNAVTYKGLWKDVDLTYAASANGVAESTYRLADPENVGAIKLRYNRPVALDRAGNLVVGFETGTMTESAPKAWQDVRGARKPVAVSFALRGTQDVGFSLSGYAPGVPVVIDPVLTWSTFLGGTGTDNLNAVMVDTSGNVYVIGNSAATWGSPVAAFVSSPDVFAAKLDSSGALVWNTFLGGAGSDTSNGGAVDASGNVYVGGQSTATWGSPVAAYTLGTDVFAAKLDGSTGARTWNTFLGGAGSDSVGVIAVDGSGNVYVGGTSSATWGTPVAAYVAGTDAFAAKLDSSGARTWSTFLGGAGNETGNGIAADGSGNVFVGGSATATWGSPVAVYTATTDGFAAKLDSLGALTWNTFFGGSAVDSVIGVVLDGSGNAYVAGSSLATWGSPVAAYTAGNDGYVVKLNGSGALVWNTFFGGSGTDTSVGVAIDGNDNIYVAGTSGATWGSPLTAYPAGADDVFAAKFTSSGTLVWNTFFGGAGSETRGKIAVDGNGAVYVGGVSPSTWGSPVAPYVLGNDAWVTKNSAVTPTTSVTINSLSADTGTSSSDFITKTAAQTISATLSAPLAVGDILYGSVNAGSTYANVTGMVSGTAVTWTGATLSGTSSIKMKVTNDFDGPVATQAYTLDTAAPTLSEVTPVATPRAVRTPAYTFNSSEAGSVAYGGDCASAVSSAISGDNTVTFSALSTGTHSNCTVQVTDAAANASAPLAVSSFIITTGGTSSSSPAAAPTVTLLAPNGGETYMAGGSVTVLWAFTGRVDLVDLSYSSDNGASWTTFAPLVSASSGSYSWSLPQIPSDNVLVKVEATDSVTAFASDVSDASFKIAVAASTVPPPPREACAVSGIRHPQLPPGTPADGRAPSPVTGQMQAVTPVAPGDYVRSPFFTTVYWITPDFHRRPFLNQSVFFTYADSFNAVRSVSDATLPLLPLDRPMLPKPGTVLVKITSTPETYLVTSGSPCESPMLHWIPTEAVAATLFGTNWNAYVLDVPVTALRLYQRGTDATASSVVDRGIMKKRVDLYAR